MKNKKCLVIGRGPSKDMVLDKEYDMDIICCKEPMHKDTIACCSCDLLSFHKKEKKAIEKNIRLIFGVDESWPNWQIKKNQLVYADEKYWPDIEIEKTDDCMGSGLWTLEWSVRQGYKEIYTAGIDNVSVHMSPRDGVLPTRSLEESFRCHKKIIGFFNLGVKVYKASEDSLLPVDVKIPPEKGQ